jgi:hypothetical protein
MPRIAFIDSEVQAQTGALALVRPTNSATSRRRPVNEKNLAIDEKLMRISD